MAAKKDDFSVKKISPKLGGERGARYPFGPTSTHDLVEQMEFLYVNIRQAKENTIVNHLTFPIVEITLGNYKSSTRSLPIRPNLEWDQVFAFDKSKGDVLSVTLSVTQSKTNTVIGKRNFKLVVDIPSRAPPDAGIAPQWYSMQNNEGYEMLLLMSVWFGTQVDEVYSLAWFSDASEVSASCVINARPKLYIAPRLCYVRVTIVSAHDLIPTDRNRNPSVYVKATLGHFALKTGLSSGSTPSWNQDLIFVVSEPLEGSLYIEIIDRVDDQHEECIGKLKKKISEMVALKLPGSAPVLFYDIEPPVKIEPAGDLRRFASRIKMKLATDQAYHVAEECSQYSSDWRAFAKGLWPGLLGKLEIGILGATGLKGRDEKKVGIDSYVVAKYGNRWARTRTVVNTDSPKWNEQYSWDVYDKCSVLTLGIYDNRQISNKNRTNDVPIGKVRIPLNRLRWDWIYTGSFPVMYLGTSGLKKMGEIQLAIRCVCVVKQYAWVSAPFRWMLPKAHYKSPLSVAQLEHLREQAVKMNCTNLANTDPPLRNEVVMDMLKPKNKSFSMRRTKANYERCYRIALYFYSKYTWVASFRTTTDLWPKVGAFLTCELIIWFPYLMLWLIFIAKICYDVRNFLWEIICKFLKRELNKRVKGIETPPPPLKLIDLELWKLESANLDELAEELDSFPSSVTDMNVLRMRYDRLRKMSEKVMSLMGDLATQFERVYALLTWRDDPLASFCFSAISSVVLFVLCTVSYQCWLSVFVFFWLLFPSFRNDLPSGINNFFRRLPTNEEMF